MGFFEGLEAEKYDRKYSDKDLGKRIIQYFRPQLARLTGIAALLLVVSTVGAMLPIVVSRGVDAIKSQPSSTGFYLVAGVVLLLGLTGWTANWGQRRLMARTVADVVLKLATDAFRSATEHDLSFYDEFASAKVVSRITSDTRDFGNLIGLVTDVISQLVEAGILLVVLLNIDWHLTLYLFALIPIVFVLAISFRTLARKTTREGMRAMANVNASIKETVSGIAVAKNFRQEAEVYQEFNGSNVQSYQVNVRRGLVLSLVFPALSIVSGIATAVLVYVGGLSSVAGAVTAGAWYLFLMSLDRFMYPVMSLSSFWTQIQNGLSASERVFALIDAEAAVVQVDQQPVPRLNGRIDFNRVSFRYKDNEPVLSELDLHIAPGETLALVGHTGAGKSSVAKLVARFYEFQSGELLIDGKDIRSFDLNQYRRQLGVVSQAPFLFSGSVLDNIRYAAPQVSESEILDLSRRIGDGEWLETLPEGLETQVGERGGRLSMGQRQLVALMRVLVQRPSIFILDEATASIDPFTEWQIQQALNLILADTTSILIAHRLSTVKSADRIIVIENGRIIEEGNHKGLLEQGGHYATLYNTYFRHQSLAYVEQSRHMVSSEGE